MPHNRRSIRILLGYLGLVAAVVLVLTPVYFLEAPAARPVVVRAGATVLAGIILIHVRRSVRARIEVQGASPFDRALQRTPWTPAVAPQFLKLRNEVRFGRSSHAYFAHVLWVRLQALAARRGHPLAGMPRRRLWGRGPSLGTLRTLVADIEERS